MNKNIVIPLILTSIVCAISFLVYGTPLSILLLPLIIISLILFVQNKSGNDWGKMFIIIIPISIIILGLFIILLYLSNDINWIDQIMSWPS